MRPRHEYEGPLATTVHSTDCHDNHRPLLRHVLIPLLTLLVATAAVLASPEPSFDEPQPATARPSQEQGGSTVPCAVPLRWSMADVDPHFGLTSGDAEAALLAAFAVWEGDSGTPIFAMDESGHPISFVFDERQASSQRRSSERNELVDAARRLDAMSAQLEERLAAQLRENAALLEAAESHRRRMQRLNDDIRDWNQRRAVPDSVRSRLMAERTTLAEEGRELERREAALQGLREALAAESLQINREVDAYNQAQLPGGGVPESPSEAGRYSEQVRTRDGVIEDVSRRIEVYRFGSSRDLVMVLAHELGHALGLGHSNEHGAVMSEVSTSTQSATPPTLSSRDVEMLDTTCPGLRAGATPH